MKQPFEVRERAEEIERASLSRWATLASETKGRDRYEDPDPWRTAFQLDRDRVLAADAFTRLAGRSHAFVPEPAGSGWRSQLGQTLAVLSVTRAMARALRLNADLAEAIAAAHAFGAPPFGPAGREALGEVLGHPFEVAEQSLKVVEFLDSDLNLTWEARDGILHQESGRGASTLEGMAAALGRRLAAALYDLRAAERAGLAHADDVPAAVRTVLGTDHQRRVFAAVTDAVTVSSDRPEVTLGPDVEEALRTLEAFLAEEIHGREAAQSEHDRAVHCLRSLAIYADSNPSVAGPGEGGVAGTVDWLAWATDREIVETFRATFVPAATAGA